MLRIDLDQLECTDPARNDFLEPSGDSTHLVHCKGSLGPGLGPGDGRNERQARAIFVGSRRFNIRAGHRSAYAFTPADCTGSKPAGPRLGLA